MAERTLKPLTVRIKRLVEESIKRKVTVYEVEPEIIRLAVFYAGLWLERYRENPRGHWTTHEAFNDVVALVGEKVVNATLEQLGIPHIWADPLFPRQDPRAHRPWDFHVAGLGSLEVKTIPPIVGYRRLMIRLDTYMASNYTVAVKLLPEIGWEHVDHAITLDAVKQLLLRVREAQLKGWLTKEQVEKLPVNNFGEGDCYWAFLNGQLNPMYLFWQKFERQPTIRR